MSKLMAVLTVPMCANVADVQGCFGLELRRGTIRSAGSGAIKGQAAMNQVNEMPPPTNHDKESTLRGQ